MNILISPDSFKGTLSAREVCDIIADAFHDVFDDCYIQKLPVADGGEGLCCCLSTCVKSCWKTASVCDVFGKKINASYLMLDDMTAVIEMASCAGLPLAGDKKNPLTTTAFGVGEMINHALSNKAQKILLGLGGSATNECGFSVASALGWRFLDKNEKSFVPTGGTLSSVNKIIPPENKFPIPVIAACDVDNPLFGENGAAFVFAPQKGADENAVKILDDGLRHASDIIKRDLSMDVAHLPGAGAAGGMGAGAVVFLGATLQRGIDIILSSTNFEEKAKDADLIITGEGKLDSQSVNGKVISGIANLGRKLNKPVITICGCHGDGFETAKNLGIVETFYSLHEEKPFDEILKTCKQDLYTAARNAAIKIKNGETL